jgi:hypothetical protein
LLQSLGLSGFGFSDDAVFAHQDSSDENREDKNDDVENTDDNQSEIETDK